MRRRDSFAERISGYKSLSASQAVFMIEQTSI